MDEEPLILVVDDEASIRQVLRGILAQEELPCRVVASATAALEVLERADVAVMVSDVRMPGMSGLDLLEKALATDPGLQVILITGESGTGKDMVARAVHYNSLRRDHPFVALNCGAVPETLLESELFGH
ncbi:MAG: sigma 54-interacting transcriptional regulator, partial [Deltaproteobacteria bacterium]|nr:sigma 54-interacting transcriptional regulator [Deltaproteobacteria bacterium]